MRLGMSELLVVLVIVVIICGPTQIPKLKRIFDKYRKNQISAEDEHEEKKDINN